MMAFLKKSILGRLVLWWLSLNPWLGISLLVGVIVAIGVVLRLLLLVVEETIPS